MAKVTLRNSFLQIYKETTDYSYQNFGRLFAFKDLTKACKQ